MFVDWSVLDFVHLVELSFEEGEILGSRRGSVQHTSLEFLESVHHFQEVAVLQEKLEVFLVVFLYIKAKSTACNGLQIIVSTGKSKPSSLK